MASSADSVQRAARLLDEAAQLVRTIAEGRPSPSETLLERADLFARTSRELAGESERAQDRPAAPADTQRQVGVWSRRGMWLDGPDIPPGAWTPFDADAVDHRSWKDAVVAALAEQDPRWADDCAFSFSFPPFLPGVTLAHLSRGAAPGWDALFNVTRRDDGGFTARSFDFASPEVHRLNFVTPINCLGLDLAYLRYFMYTVRAKEGGTFRLLEGRILDQARPHLQTVDLPDGRGPVLESLHPPRFSRVSGAGGIVYTAWLLYVGAIFKAELAVFPDGRVEMLEDEPQLQGIGALHE